MIVYDYYYAVSDNKIIQVHVVVVGKPQHEGQQSTWSSAYKIFQKNGGDHDINWIFIYDSEN